MPQTDLVRLWEEHTNHEFSTLAYHGERRIRQSCSGDDGWCGEERPTHFLFGGFHSQDAARHETNADFRNVGEEQLVDEMIFSFTHTQEMPWMLPGIPPTNRYVEVVLVAIVRFRDGKLDTPRAQLGGYGSEAHLIRVRMERSALKALGDFIDR